VNKENKIYCWSKIPDNPSPLPIDFKPQKISNDSHPTVWSQIIENTFVYLLEESGRELVKRKYSHIWDLKLKQEEGFSGEGILLCPVLKFGFQFIKPHVSKKIVYCLSVRKCYPPKLILSDEEYIARNVDTRNWGRNQDGEIISSFANIKKFLEATGQTAQYKSFKNQAYLQQSEYKIIKDFEENLNKIKDKLFLPDGMKITSFLFNTLPNSNFEQNTISKPTYYFHNERTGVGLYNDRIKKLKPTSYDNFKNREVKILVLTPLKYEGSAGSFSTELIKILKEVFHIQNIKRDTKTFEHRTPHTYSNLLKELDVEDYDLVLQVVTERDKKRHVNESPYFVFKAKMLNQKVPTQKVLIETIRKDDASIMNIIALNIYSKLGGTAWTIEKDEKDKTEIIIGISSTVDFKKRRIIGFANVIDYRGCYLTGDCTQLSDFEDYQTNLEAHLISTISEVIKDKNIQEGGVLRLIFHLTKEAGKKNELKAIENTLGYFHKYQIQFGIFHLSYGHNYRVFKNKGEYDVDRGTYIQLSNKLALLHLGKPSKTPILIRMDKRSTYRDIYAASKQVLFFAHLSHRSFRPSSRPVTISYPAQMAKLVSELKEVSDWDKDMLNRLKGILWFI